MEERTQGKGISLHFRPAEEKEGTTKDNEEER